MRAQALPEHAAQPVPGGRARRLPERSERHEAQRARVPAQSRAQEPQGWRTRSAILGGGAAMLSTTI